MIDWLTVDAHLGITVVGYRIDLDEELFSIECAYCGVPLLWDLTETAKNAALEGGLPFPNVPICYSCF